MRRNRKLLKIFFYIKLFLCLVVCYFVFNSMGKLKNREVCVVISLKELELEDIENFICVVFIYNFSIYDLVEI